MLMCKVQHSPIAWLLDWLFLRRLECLSEDFSLLVSNFHVRVDRLMICVIYSLIEKKSRFELNSINAILPNIDLNLHEWHFLRLGSFPSRRILMKNAEWTRVNALDDQDE